MRITKKQAARVLEVVDKGLVCGLGVRVPGKMCVEAAVCYALGLPHGDKPPCVAKCVREFKIKLNDHWLWESDKARTKGMRQLAVAQLGSVGVVSKRDFSRQLVKLADEKLDNFDKEAVLRDPRELTSCAYSQDDLLTIADIAVEALRQLKSPGVKLWDALVKDGVA